MSKLFNFNIFIFLILISQFSFGQDVKVIDGDVLNFDTEIEQYIIGVIVANDSFLWGYYDCTDCADFFLSKIDSEKDSSFISYFQSQGIKIYAMYPSYDGHMGQRCVLCTCANGHRINFKILKIDYPKMLALLKGTINQGYLNRYR